MYKHSTHSALPLAIRIPVFFMRYAGWFCTVQADQLQIMAIEIRKLFNKETSIGQCVENVCIKSFENGEATAPEFSAMVSDLMAMPEIIEAYLNVPENVKLSWQTREMFRNMRDASAEVQATA